MEPQLAALKELAMVVMLALRMVAQSVDPRDVSRAAKKDVMLAATTVDLRDHSLAANLAENLDEKLACLRVEESAHRMVNPRVEQ